MSRPYKLKRRAERQDETRQRIIEATIELHQTIGPAATTITEIAERAGVGRVTVYRHFPDEPTLDYKRVRGGFLVQDRFRYSAVADESKWQMPTTRRPTDAQWNDLRFAWAALGSVKSNAILIAREEAAIGIGAGQMSRVDASFLAVHKARQQGHDPAGAVMASDAFFPFRDGVDEAAAAGISAIIQPGGSVKDNEVIAAADEHGIAMILTGMRQFRH